MFLCPLDRYTCNMYRILLQSVKETATELYSVQQSGYEESLVLQFRERLESLNKIYDTCQQIYKRPVYIYNFSNNNTNESRSEGWNLYYTNRFICECNRRLEMYTSYYVTDRRRIHMIFGDFCESLSPKMTRDVYFWLRKIKPLYFRPLFRARKEDILRELKRKHMVLNAHLLCDFIENVNPIWYVTEWNVQTYENGKKKKNVRIRNELKTEFHRRERNYLRCACIHPRIRSLPKNVEEHIKSFVC